MQITITFNSLEEFLSHIKTPAEGFVDPIVQGEPVPVKAFEEATAATKAIVADAPEGFQPAEEAAPFEEDKAAEITEDFRVEVRKALAKLNKQTGKNSAAEIIQAHGFKRLTEVPLSELPAIMAEAKEALG